MVFKVVINRQIKICGYSKNNFCFFLYYFYCSHKAIFNFYFNIQDFFHIFCFSKTNVFHILIRDFLFKKLNRIMFMINEYSKF